MKKKKIGILTNGGDCSGLNSVIRAAFIRSHVLGYELIGMMRGFRGMVERPINYIILDKKICDESLLASSGSVLLANTSPARKCDGSEISHCESSKLICEAYNELGLSGLIHIGGDGSLSILNSLMSYEDSDGINIIAVPKTIDNDVANTDMAIGFSTAVEVASQAIENIRSTAKSHERVMVIEVMGRDAGFISLYSGIAAGADAILIPESRFNIEELNNTVRKCYESGKNHCIIVVSEAVESAEFRHSDGKAGRRKYNGIGEYLSSCLRQSGFNSRSVVLGHVQRGGNTSITDRLIGSAFGVEAVNLIDSGKNGLMVSYKGGRIAHIPIKNNVNKKVNSDDLCVGVAKDLGIYIGEI